jgi:flagellar FliL protein
MAENNQEAEQGEEKKSSKMLIIIAVVVLLLAAAGGGYFFMSGDETTEDGATQVEEESEEPAVESLYFEMDKAFIVNFPKGSHARLLQVSISLLVEGEETVAALKKHEPMIRNNILMLMSAQDTSELKEIAGKEKLRSKMLEEINNTMKKMTQNSKIKELFFTAFVMQ